jgi:hypothetical protein
MNKSLVILLIACFCSCISSKIAKSNCGFNLINNESKEYNNNCTTNINFNEMNILDSSSIKIELENKADEIMKKNRYKLEDLKRTIYLCKECYFVHYAFALKDAYGGGGLLVFNKELKLINKCFEE